MMLTPENMAHIQKTKGWSQSDFAKVLDVSQPTICNWLKKPPQRGPASKLLVALLKATGGDNAKDS